MEYKIPMRIIVVSPPVGVNFALENKRKLGFGYRIYGGRYCV